MVMFIYICPPLKTIAVKRIYEKLIFMLQPVRFYYHQTLTLFEVVLGIRSFFSSELRLDHVPLLAMGVANALLHEISLPSCNRGSKLSGTDPIGGVPMGLNLHQTLYITIL